MQETQEIQVETLGQEGPLEKEMATHSSILAGKFHGQRSLAGCSPWGCEESDMIERTCAHTHTHTQLFPCLLPPFSTPFHSLLQEISKSSETEGFQAA